MCSSFNKNKEIYNFYDSLKILEITCPKRDNFNEKEFNYLQKLRFNVYLNILNKYKKNIDEKGIQYFKFCLFRDGINYYSVKDIIDKQQNKIETKGYLFNKNGIYILDIKKKSLGYYGMIMKYFDDILIDNWYVSNILYDSDTKLYQIILSNPIDMFFSFHIKISK